MRGIAIELLVALAGLLALGVREAWTAWMSE